MPKFTKLYDVIPENQEKTVLKLPDEIIKYIEEYSSCLMDNGAIRDRLFWDIMVLRQIGDTNLFEKLNGKDIKEYKNLKDGIISYLEWVLNYLKNEK